EPKEVRAQVTKLLADREDKDPAQAKREQRNSSLRRLITFLTNTKRDLEREHLLPAYLLKQMADLTQKLQDQIETG
ncbi:MAG TPA: hypothetical protein VD913_06305, partial [bacterium]|nr:hypothetical protein [bacterium]